MSERVISADSHVNITHDRVKANLPAKYHQDYDRAVDEQLAVMAEFYGGRQLSTDGQGKLANFTHPAKGRPGHFDPVERLKDMDIDGVDTEVLYSEVTGFRYLYRLRDGSAAATRAFNDALYEFGSVDAKRLVVSYQIPIHDIDAAITEVRRVAALGAKSLQLPAHPSELDLPDYYDGRYDPLWSEVQETGLPMCFHIGLHTGLKDVTRRDPTPQAAIYTTMVALMTAEAIGMWIFGGILERFERLKIVWVEPGVGWIPWFLWNADDMRTHGQYEMPAISQLPSFYWARNMAATFINEPFAVADPLVRQQLGTANLMWSTDYPHQVSSWPNSRSTIEQQFQGVPEEERRAMLSGNAARIWALA
jgi:uncharacterized protein